MTPIEQARIFGVANEDFLSILHYRRQILLENQRELFARKQVLEIGPLTGYMTEFLLEQNCSMSLIERDPTCAKILRSNFKSRIMLVEDDFHRALFKFPAGGIEVVICAGVLYHSPSPVVLLEAIAALRPELVLIDSLVSQEMKVIQCEDNGSERSRVTEDLINPSTGFALRLPPSTIELTMTRLGYKVEIDLSGFNPPAEMIKSAYSREWMRGFRKWFRRSS